MVRPWRTRQVPAYGYVGLGDIAVFFFFGPVAVAGTAYLMTHHITRLSLLSSIPMGCLITAILVVNNLRDIETDRVAGKMTLAVRLGTGGARAEYTVLLLVFLLDAGGMLARGLSGLGPLLSLVTAAVGGDA